MTTPSVSKIAGTGYRQINTPALSPEQQQLFSQIIKGIQPGLTDSLGQLSQMARGGSSEYWDQLEAPAMRQFNQLQGNIASRFSGIGSGARNSSGFQNTMNTASTDLAERLQGQRVGLQQDAISQLMSLYGNLIGTNTMDTAFVPGKQKKKSFWQELFGGAAPGFGNILGNLGSLAFF